MAKIDTTENWCALMLAAYTDTYADQALREFNLISKKPAVRDCTKKVKWTEERIAEVRRLRQNKVSWKKIGAMFGCSGGSVYKAYHKHGPKVFDDWEPGEE